VVTLVAKADVRHVERALRTSREENLAMVRDSVAHLRAEGQRVFLDAEHFFDGYAADPAYAVEVLRTAAEAGADVLVLCDTNGGMLPSRLAEVVAEVVRTGLRVGIHAHDDAACAVANSLAAVEAGATHVQGTANGYGERCGNADLFSVVAALEVKVGRQVLPPGPAGRARPRRARGRRGGQHRARPAPAVGRRQRVRPQGGPARQRGQGRPDLYQHTDPAVVGNVVRLLVSELAGRATIELKGQAMGLSPDRDTVARVLDRVKDLEHVGYSFEAADASFELLLRDEMGERPHYFELESWRVIVEHRTGDVVSEATVKLRAQGQRIVATGEGNGPVNALDNALRTALCGLYPGLGRLELVDYKVRIVSGAHGTDAVTRVLVETSDGTTSWDTVGVHENVIAASWQALEEAYTTGLLRQERAVGVAARA
jgi:2-isopropylmalate synthase